MIRVTHNMSKRAGTLITPGAAMGLMGSLLDRVLFDGDTDSMLVPSHSLTSDVSD